VGRLRSRSYQPPSDACGRHHGAGWATKPATKECRLTFDFEWAELPDDIAQRKQQAWHEWEAADQQLHDPTQHLPADEVGELERRQRATWKQYWHADGARYHLSNRQMADGSTAMVRAGMARQVPTPPVPRPGDYDASPDEYGDWLDATDRGDPLQPSPALQQYLAALDRHQQANYNAQVIPVHKLWTNDGWLVTPDEITAALPHAPQVALDRRQRPIPWWDQWLAYLDSARSHGGIRVR
jgi:hypothetical protein